LPDERTVFRTRAHSFRTISSTGAEKGALSDALSSSVNCVSSAWLGQLRSSALLGHLHFVSVARSSAFRQLRSVICVSSASLGHLHFVSVVQSSVFRQLSLDAKARPLWSPKGELA
jgi:hypothetical protein